MSDNPKAWAIEQIRKDERNRLRTEGRERVEKVLFEISDSYRLYNKNMRMAWADRILSALFDEEGK